MTLCPRPTHGDDALYPDETNYGAADTGDPLPRDRQSQLQVEPRDAEQSREEIAGDAIDLSLEQVPSAGTHRVAHVEGGGS
jgi:hypothetical protein